MFLPIDCSGYCNKPNGLLWQNIRKPEYYKAGAMPNIASFRVLTKPLFLIMILCAASPRCANLRLICFVHPVGNIVVAVGGYFYGQGVEPPDIYVGVVAVVSGLAYGQKITFGIDALNY